MGKLGPKASPSDVMGKTTESISKYPSVVELLRNRAAPKDRPKPSEKPTCYKNGKIYFSKAKKMLRVYTRSYDKIEKAIKVDATNKANFAREWGLACACIEVDSRKKEL